MKKWNKTEGEAERHKENTFWVRKKAFEASES